MDVLTYFSFGKIIISSQRPTSTKRMNLSGHFYAIRAGQGSEREGQSRAEAGQEPEQCRVSAGLTPFLAGGEGLCFGNGELRTQHINSADRHCRYGYIYGAFPEKLVGSMPVIGSQLK